MDYLSVKWLHVVSSTILFGTGIGTAFFMLATSLTRQVQAVAVVSRFVVLADWLFTTPAIVVQPLTGFYLIHLTGISLGSPWVVWSIVLYLIAGICWLPVVWLQLRMRRLAAAAAGDNSLHLPALYWRYLAIWTALGVPAFCALIAVFYLMTAKPMWSL